MTSATARDDSGVASAASKLRAAVANARATRLARSVAGVLRQVTATSRISRAGRGLGRALRPRIAGAVRGSRFYGWLTAEPEPRPVEIDLRETVTIDPVLAGVDRAVALASRGWEGSVLSGVGEAVQTSVERAPVRVVSGVAAAAVATRLVLNAALGSLDRAALGVGLLALAVALAGTRVRVSRAELAASPVGRAVGALWRVVAPPAGERSESPADDDDDDAW